MELIDGQLVESLADLSTEAFVRKHAERLVQRGLAGESRIPLQKDWAKWDTAHKGEKMSYEGAHEALKGAGFKRTYKSRDKAMGSSPTAMYEHANGSRAMLDATHHYQHRADGSKTHHVSHSVVFAKPGQQFIDGKHVSSEKGHTNQHVHDMAKEHAGHAGLQKDADGDDDVTKMHRFMPEPGKNKCKTCGESYKAGKHLPMGK